MSTTVPQNMKGMKIAGRHTPTRNSLRHSRMIVVNHKNHDSTFFLFPLMLFSAENGQGLKNKVSTRQKVRRTDDD